jgi:hypothetical protein
MESALTTSPPNSSATRVASADFPLAVGPATTTIGISPEISLGLLDITLDMGFGDTP